MSAPGTPAAGQPRRRLLFLLPLAVFVALAGVFLVRLQAGGDPEAIPSALIGKPAPQFDLPPLDGMRGPAGPLPGLKTADLAGHVTVLNIFASWCAPCRAEHPQLEALAGDDRIRLVAINYGDVDENARRFLGEMGNPFAAIGTDRRRRAGIDWGVYGVPETFIIGRDGTIRYKFVGPIDEQSLASVIRPAIDKALAAN
ncbi:MAG: DsbE family thiol:disulfide interchange protein [Rhizobiales bacterium]|nr:DsbE family thiol:disulfide interchange protein [Hyphomicrobiales bacterium]